MNDKDKENRKQIGGAAAILGGVSLGDKVRREGLLDGRKKLYHNTRKENIEGVLEKGLLASKANDVDNFTNTVMRTNGVEDLKPFQNKTYLATKKRVADSVGLGRARLDLMQERGLFPIPPSINEMQKHSKQWNKTLKASVPIDDFKALKKVRNPELQGLSPYGYAKKLYDESLVKNPAQLIDNTIGAHSMLKDTVVVDGDFAAKHFKKSEHYVKNSPKQIAKYIAKHPGRAGLGVLGAGAAAGLTAGGAKMIYDSTRNKNASIYMDAIEKVAMSW